MNNIPLVLSPNSWMWKPWFPGASPVIFPQITISDSGFYTKYTYRVHYTHSQAMYLRLSSDAERRVLTENQPHDYMTAFMTAQHLWLHGDSRLHASIPLVNSRPHVVNDPRITNYSTTHVTVQSCSRLFMKPVRRKDVSCVTSHCSYFLLWPSPNIQHLQSLNRAWSDFRQNP